jgi:hypothetical protein
MLIHLGFLGGKKLRQILISTIMGIILMISGLGAVASLDDKEVNLEEVKYDFSRPILKNNNEFLDVSFDETNTYLINFGKPIIPAYKQSFSFPIGTKINNINCVLSNFHSIEISNDITPSPNSAIIGSVQQHTQKSYEIIGTYPEQYFDYNIRVGLYEGVRKIVVNVVIYPLSYNQQEKTITWADDALLNIEYEPIDEPHTTSVDYDFIILTADEFYNELEVLKTHKNNRGINTEIFTLSDILNQVSDGRDDAEKVKYFIKDALDNWNVRNIMLVGNKDKFPTRNTHIRVSNSDSEIFVSDLYFADIYSYNETSQLNDFVGWDSNENDIFAEYDWNNEYDFMDLSPDVRLGRLPANNKNEINAIVNKIINYENDVSYTKDWFTDIVTVGGDSFPGDEDQILEGELVNEEVIDVMDGFIPERIWVTLGKLNSRSDLNSALRDGCGFVDFSGHGNTNVWATHPHENHDIWLPGPTGGYFSSDISNLNNGEKLPIVITGACSVSKFSKDKNSFSWSWLANSIGGGIAAFGATGLGYAYLGKWVTFGLVEGMAISTFESFDDGAITVGEMWERALNGYMDSHSINDGGEYKTVLEWTLFGDPTLSVSSESTPPSKPLAPNGPTNAGIKREHIYTSSTDDIDGDDIYYLFDWGDGTYSRWIGPYSSGEEASASHSWEEQGSYEVRVKAKDEHGQMSDWSDPLPITLPKTKNLNLPIYSWIYHYLPNIYEILNLILSH